MPQFRHLVRLPGIRTGITVRSHRSPHGDTQQTLEPHQSEGAHQFKKVDLTGVEKKLPQFRHLVRLPGVRTRHHSIGTSGALTETRSRH